MMKISKEDATYFCDKVLSTFLVELKNNGLKFKDTTFQESFLLFVTDSLKTSLSKVFAELEYIIKDK